MRFAARVVLSLLLTVFVAAGCGEGRDPVGVPDSPQFGLGEGNSPFQFPAAGSFNAVNVCTGEIHTVSFTGIVSWQPHPNNAVFRIMNVFTTSDGYTGRYEETWSGSNLPGDAGPGDVSARTFHVLMSSPSGSRIMVHAVWVLDLKTESLRVDRFTATCVQP